MTFLRWLKKLSLTVSEMKSICYIVLRSTDAQQIHDSVNRSEYVQGLDSLLRHCLSLRFSGFRVDRFSYPGTVWRFPCCSVGGDVAPAAHVGRGHQARAMVWVKHA